MAIESSEKSSNDVHSNGSTNHYVVPLQINGKEIITKTTFNVVDPGTDKVIWEGSSASKKDAAEAVEAAQAAFPAWSKMKPAARRDIFLKAADILASHEDEYMKYMMVQTGSSESTARINVSWSVEMLRDVACRIMTVHGTIPVCGEEGKSALLFKEPYGVIFGICPWYPIGIYIEDTPKY